MSELSQHFFTVLIIYFITPLFRFIKNMGTTLCYLYRLIKLMFLEIPVRIFEQKTSYLKGCFINSLITFLHTDSKATGM